MELVWKIVYVFLISGLELFIFFKVDGIVLTLERVFKSFLFKLLLAVVFVTIKLYSRKYLPILFYGTLVRHWFIFLIVKRAS